MNRVLLVLNRSLSKISKTSNELDSRFNKLFVIERGITYHAFMDDEGFNRPRREVYDDEKGTRGEFQEWMDKLMKQFSVAHQG